MNAITNHYNWLDFVLADIAAKIQLSATDYELAQERYRAISEYVSAPSSPITQYHPYIYPQGSFRIQSTTSSHDDEADYDIDLVMELAIRRDSSPDAVLKVVFDALDRGPGSRYHGKCEIKRRCVTVHYEGMHLDVTPAVLLDRNQRRLISIFDTHPYRSDHVVANPEGFATWFDERVLPRDLFEERLAKAMAEPVPDQKPLDAKPLRLVSLQLMKRARDLCQDAHRKPKIPSVLLSKLSADAPQASQSLYGDLVGTIDYLLRRLSIFPLEVRNPACNDDNFTDRWPAGAEAQQQFLADLRAIRGGLDELKAAGPQEDKQKVVGRLFGERVTQRAYETLAKHLGERSRMGQQSFLPGSGGIITGLSSVGSSSVAPIKSHHFFGAHD
ncbi:hypothetical protein GAY28_08815 [Azospirillum brasilense]|nr:hypothetical protein [Azospirillum brasilense]